VQVPVPVHAGAAAEVEVVAWVMVMIWEVTETVTEEEAIEQDRRQRTV
jgi:hypothetical protein